MPEEGFLVLLSEQRNTWQFGMESKEDVRLSSSEAACINSCEGDKCQKFLNWKNEELVDSVGEGNARNRKEDERKLWASVQGRDSKGMVLPTEVENN